MKSVLSIAGSDSSGGAGIQADIKAICAHDMFAQTVITALTAQNTLGVTGVECVDPQFVEAQIDAVFADIVPDAVKIGMVPSAEIAQAVSRALVRNGAKNIVVDPVMVATSGASLSEDSAVKEVVASLFPLASVVTPNLAEAQVLADMPISCSDDLFQAAERIAQLTPSAVLVKGGHSLPGQEDRCDDLLLEADGSIRVIASERIDTDNTHGTGCTLSSAIACGLAQQLSVGQAVGQAKRYLVGALSTGLDLGKGSGPLDHLWNRR